MKLMRRIDALLEVATSEDLDEVVSAIYSLSDYINSVVKMESGIKVARARCNTQEDLVHEIERLDKSRRYKHNAAIISTKVLNRLCVIYNIDIIFLGNTDDRYEVAAFAKEVSDNYYECGAE